MKSSGIPASYQINDEKHQNTCQHVDTFCFGVILFVVVKQNRKMDDGGDGFDLCECIWGHELSMNRLLSLLRQSQSHCTDTECFVDANQPRQETASDYYIVMSIMLVIYFFMHYWMVNHRRGRNTIAGDTKPSNGHGSNDGPPTPPPSTT